jgi:hypothetical protein
MIMASIGNDRMIVRGAQRGDTSWLFTICYTANFTAEELGERFEDSVRIGRAECPVVFTATGPRVFRKKRIVVDIEDITAVDGTPDSVCAWIRLHGCADAESDDEQATPALLTPYRRSVA